MELMADQGANYFRTTGNEHIQANNEGANAFITGYGIIRGKGFIPLGTVLCGKYRVDEFLGKGNVEVYRVSYKDGVFAVKVYGSNSEPSAEEFNILEKLRFYRSIVHVKNHDFDKNLQRWCLLLEFLPGINLEQIINLPKDQKNSILAEPNFWMRFIEDVLDAIAFSHRSNIVHRDLKPSNIMYVNDGKRIYFKLLDFGIAQKIKKNGKTEFHQEGGTPAYMSPEQYIGGKVGPASDFYSFCAVMLRLLTDKLAIGAAPFENFEDKAKDFIKIFMLPRLRQILYKNLSADLASRSKNAELLKEELLGAMYSVSRRNEFEELKRLFTEHKQKSNNKWHLHQRKLIAAKFMSELSEFVDMEDAQFQEEINFCAKGEEVEKYKTLDYAKAIISRLIKPPVATNDFIGLEERMKKANYILGLKMPEVAEMLQDFGDKKHIEDLADGKEVKEYNKAKHEFEEWVGVLKNFDLEHVNLSNISYNNKIYKKEDFPKELAARIISSPFFRDLDITDQNKIKDILFQNNENNSLEQNNPKEEEVKNSNQNFISHSIMDDAGINDSSIFDPCPVSEEMIRNGAGSSREIKYNENYELQGYNTLRGIILTFLLSVSIFLLISTLSTMHKLSGLTFLFFITMIIDYFQFEKLEIERISDLFYKTMTAMFVYGFIICGITLKLFLK